MHLDFIFEVQEMSEKNLKKRLEFQQKMISRQSEQIDGLKSKIAELELTIEKKDELIKSVDYLRKELIDNIDEIKQKKNEYEKLIKQLKDMEKIMNQEVYRNRWNLVRLLIK